MSKWRFWTSHSLVWPYEVVTPRPEDKDRQAGITWPFPAQRTVRIKDPKAEYFVDIEVYFDPERSPEEGPVVTGIAVRSGAPLDPKADGIDWREGGQFEAVSLREARELPLSTYVDAALTIASDPFGMESDEKLRRIILPRGLPGEGTIFYEGIAELYRQLTARGERKPVREIAQRMSSRLGEDVPENRVHQWLFRARDLGFLERPESRSTTPKAAARKRSTTPRTTKGGSR